LKKLGKKGGGSERSIADFGGFNDGNSKEGRRQRDGEKKKTKNTPKKEATRVGSPGSTVGPSTLRFWTGKRLLYSP